MALARLCKWVASPDHSLLACVIFFMNWPLICSHEPSSTSLLFSGSRCSHMRYHQTFLNWPIKFGLSLHIHSIFLFHHVFKCDRSVKLALILLQQKMVKLAAILWQKKTVKLAQNLLQQKTVKLAAIFLQQKNGKVSSNSKKR